MLIPITCVLIFSPAFWVELTIDRSVFPKDVDNLDRVGLFKLKDGHNDRLVLLYYYDSDSVAEKSMAKNGFTMKSYPNFFSVHAIHQVESGKWVNKEVFGFARVRFTKVAKVTPEYLILECRPNFIIRLDLLKDTGQGSLKRAAEINRPFTMQVSFVSGVLTAK